MGPVSCTLADRLLAVALLLAAGPASAGLIPGGGPARSDCYVEADIQGIEVPGPAVTNGRIVRCTDGDPCDADGVCGNGVCAIPIALCIGVADPNLPACTPPRALRRLTVGGPTARVVPFPPAPPSSLSGGTCGQPAILTLPLRQRRNGKTLPGRVALAVNATAERGTTPARDRDRYVVQCVPAPTCGASVITTTTTTLPGMATATVTVGPGGDLRFDPDTVRIRAGGTVRWRWGSGGHNVVGGAGGTADGSFCSPADRQCAGAGLSSTGATYEHTFPTAGTFPYFCAPHGAFGMTGRVIVEP
jgi:plastocyanin